MDHQGYRIFMIIIILVCLFSIAVYWLDYIRLGHDLNNPLIPKEALLGHAFKVALIRSVPKFIIAGMCGWYLFSKRLFWPIAITSLSVLILEAVFRGEIYNYVMQ